MKTEQRDKLWSDIYKAIGGKCITDTAAQAATDEAVEAVEDWIEAQPASEQGEETYRRVSAKTRDIFDTLEDSWSKGENKYVQIIEKIPGGTNLFYGEEIANTQASQPEPTDFRDVDFRKDIAEELTREELIDRLCETTQLYRELREKHLFSSLLPDVTEEMTKLKHFATSVSGLWATDRPELITDPKKVMFKIKYNGNS